MSARLRTIAGLLLYRHLPEEYRYRDNPGDGEIGDLEAYLHGFGHLLDRSRATLEQLYADSFAEPVDFPFLKRRNPGGAPEYERRSRAIQPWLLPYLADLLGAELLAPDPAARRRELAKAVLWSQSRGTLRTLDELSDVVADAATVAIEGWRRVVTTPNLTLPPFTRPLAGHEAQRRLPRGTPDTRRVSRAVLREVPRDPLARGTLRGRDIEGLPLRREIAWEVLAPEGVPCFPGSYEDLALRTPDTRTPDPRAAGGPRGLSDPAGVVLHTRPLYGFFEPGLRSAAVAANAFPPDPEGATAVYGPNEADPTAPPELDKLVVEGDVTIRAGGPVVLRGLLFRGTLRVARGARLTLERCAVARLELRAPATQSELAVEARDCLFGEIAGRNAFARLEYVTVLGDTALRRIQASDCLFAGAFPAVDCGEGGSCVRHSRVPPEAPDGACKSLRAPPNTTAAPVFLRFRVRTADGGCALRVPNFGEAGCGVLDLATPRAIREGAEDEGEVGAYHHAFHMARLRALERKLAAHTPAGIAPRLTLDIRLSEAPPRAVPA